MFSDGDNLADTFVSTDNRGLGLQWPICFADVEICVTDPGTDHLDETFARPKIGWLCYGEVALDHHRLLGARYDCRNLSLWDLIGHG